MADRSKIEWTGRTWNPTTGCTEVSPGCDRCYAKTMHERFNGKGSFAVVRRSDDKLYAPFSWRKPSLVFVNSMSDLFHDQVPDSFIVHVFSVMARTPQHTYQLLTKRHGRMRSLLNSPEFQRRVHAVGTQSTDPAVADAWIAENWPLPNLWVGVSVEDQKRADLRIPALLDTPAAVRWLSCEPLLGPVTLANDHTGHEQDHDGGYRLICVTCSTDDNSVEWQQQEFPAIDWVVVGGESGHGARPMEPGWARSLRDQCVAAGVPYFFKQWGEWAPNGYRGIGHFHGRERLVGPAIDDLGHREVIERVGKKAAGRELDGRTWDEYPLTAGTNATDMRPGTIVELGNTVLRRRPYATGGLPWKASATGARYEHAEVDALIARGAKVSTCKTCAAGQTCVPHDLVGAGAVAAAIAAEEASRG